MAKQQTTVLSLLALALLVSGASAGLTGPARKIMDPGETAPVVAPIPEAPPTAPAPEVERAPAPRPLAAPIRTAPEPPPLPEAECPPVLQLDEPDWARGVMVDPDVRLTLEAAHGTRYHVF